MSASLACYLCTLNHASLETLNQLLFTLFPDPVAAGPVCQCVTQYGACGQGLSTDPGLASEHLRDAHGLRGDSRQKIRCPWQGCDSQPIQQRNMTRHILSVHLSLSRWTCPQCLKSFSRKAVPHHCHPHGGGMRPHA